jgi:hypothetical protein
MEDLIVPQDDNFSRQAKVHHQIRDSLNEIVSSFDVHHDTILNQLDSSQIGHYSDWWQIVKTYLLNQADLHDQLGKHLITAQGNYQTADLDIANVFHGFQEKNTPPVN